jgi:hypothetical protein
MQGTGVPTDPSEVSASAGRRPVPSLFGGSCRVESEQPHPTLAVCLSISHL